MNAIVRPLSVFSLLLCLLIGLCGVGSAESADPELPAIVLNGGDSLDWPCGRPFTDPGFSACLPDGGDASEAVITEGGVTCWRPGDYTLLYRLCGADGEELARAERRVRVCPVELPEAIPTHNSIYLSFDDGPDLYTDEVLDILAKYKIKATFFVVAGKTHHLELLPRIVEEGHTLGIHAYKHDYEHLYSSPEAFFEDFIAAQEVIYRWTGQYAQVARLPGGSRSACFPRRSLRGGPAEFEQMIHNMGVRYYDWHVQPESELKTPLGTLACFTHPKEPYDGSIVLLHDVRRFSVLALEDMIRWALDEGYEFLPIDITTPEIHFVP